jgi:hypothetical protein
MSKIATERIDFSIDFGTNPIQSPGEILTFSGIGVERRSGFYECTSGTGQLSFPNKYLVKIVAEPVGDDSDFQFANGNINRIVERTELFIEPVQMTGNAVVFEMKNIRLISAEITNCPYRQITPQYSLNADNNVAVITTNVKVPFTLRAKKTNNLPVSPCDGIAYGNNMWMVTLRNGDLYRATVDHKNWTKIPCPNSRFAPNYRKEIVCGSEAWMLIVDMAGEAFSTDGGASWTYRGCGLDKVEGIDGWRRVNYGNGVFRAIHPNGKIASVLESNLGTGSVIPWIRANSDLATVTGSSSNWRDIAWDGENNWVALYLNGTMATASMTAVLSDETNWTKITDSKLTTVTGLSNNWVCLACFDNTRVVLNSNGTVASSGDGGVNWTVLSPSATSVLTSGWVCLTHGNGKLVALNSNGTVVNLTDNKTLFDCENGYIRNDSNVEIAVANLDYQPIVISSETYAYVENSDRTYTITLDLENVGVADLQMLNSAPIFEYLSHDPDQVADANSVLYYGVKDGIKNEGAWYGSNYDASTACKNVTIDACDKLKKNGNLRIYVVKYRKQEGDYGYIDKCASGENYFYEAADEAELTLKLQAIAADIKSAGFAGYQAAKNVP